MPLKTFTSLTRSPTIVPALVVTFTAAANAPCEASKLSATTDTMRDIM
jgi:hypothetical protein